MHTKISQHYEPRLVSEYVSQTFPHALVMYDVPLGPIPQNLAEKIGEAQAARIARTSRPRADAIVILPSELVIIEGKIMDVNQGLGMIDLYAMAIPETPELEAYWSLPVRKVLVAANPPEWAAQICPRAHIELVIYQPEWVKDYMNWRNQEGTIQRRQRREKRKQTLRSLGFADGA